MIARFICAILFFVGSVDSQECSCQYQLLDNSNIGNYIEETNPFFKKINSTNLRYPELKNGCSAAISCANEGSLLVFDSTGLGKLFGNTSANATCVSPTNTWNIDTGNGPEDPTSFNELWGTCMVTEPEPSCNCISNWTDSTNMHHYVDPSNPFYPVVASPGVRLPDIHPSGCTAYFSCEYLFTLLIFDSTGLGRTGFYRQEVSGTCDPKTQKWKVDTGSSAGPTTFKEMYGVCL